MHCIACFVPPRHHISAVATGGGGDDNSVDEQGRGGRFLMAPATNEEETMRCLYSWLGEWRRPSMIGLCGQSLLRVTVVESGFSVQGGTYCTLGTTDGELSLWC